MPVVGAGTICYFLTFCPSKMSHTFSQNFYMYQKHQNVLFSNMNMDTISNTNGAS